MKVYLTIILITHEMDAVKRVANKIAVMQHKIIEKGESAASLLAATAGTDASICRWFTGGHGYAALNEPRDA